MADLVDYSNGQHEKTVPSWKRGALKDGEGTLHRLEVSKDKLCFL